jgi:hypothetical protein
MTTSKTPLIKALEGFGRRAMCLSVAKLEAVQGILVALFGDEVRADGDLLHDRAVRVHAALLEIIGGLPDKTDRRIVTAVLAAEKQFHNSSVEDRLLILFDEGISSDVYWTRRPELLRQVAAELMDRFGSESTVDMSVPLSAEARRAARQLSFYAQEAAARIEVLDVANRAIDDLRQRGECWPEPRYIASRNSQAERALWAYAHCCTHLRDLERDDTGREFLAEHFPVSPWHLGLDAGLSESARVELQQVLAEVALDEPEPFWDALLARGDRVSVERSWLRLMSAPALERAESSDDTAPGKGEGEKRRLRSFSGEERFRLLNALDELTDVLGPIFPEQTKACGVTLGNYAASAWGLVSMEMPEGGPNMGPDYEKMMMAAVDAARQQLHDVWAEHTAAETATRDAKRM